MKAATKSMLFACAVVALVSMLAGCGGGGSAVPIQPRPPDDGQPPAGTASVAGWVVNAQDTTLALPNAQVTATPGTSTTSAADGGFRINNLPAGAIELVVQPAAGQSFWGARLTVNVLNGIVTPVVVALVPQNLAVPDRLLLQPDQATLDPGSFITFQAYLWAGSVRSSISPSWAVEGNVGALSPGSPGRFSATQVGAGKVVAVAGSQRGEADVTVTTPQPPRIWSVFINPTTQPATGGSSVMTVHATDGDGIKQVTAEIFKPGGAKETITLDRASGIQSNGQWVDATYAATYNFPRNTSTPDALGNQPVQTYDLRFQVQDNRNVATRKNATTGQEWYQAQVLGLEAPPPPVE